MLALISEGSRLCSPSSGSTPLHGCSRPHCCSSWHKCAAFLSSWGRLGRTPRTEGHPQSHPDQVRPVFVMRTRTSEHAAHADVPVCSGSTAVSCLLHRLLEAERGSGSGFGVRVRVRVCVAKGEGRQQSEMNYKCLTVKNQHLHTWSRIGFMRSSSHPLPQVILLSSNIYGEHHRFFFSSLTCFKTHPRD